MNQKNHCNRVLSDDAIDQLRETSIHRLRTAIANRHQGCHQRHDNYARAVEEAVLQALQEDIERSRRYQALIQHHGPEILARTFGIEDQAKEQAACHLDQIAEEALSRAFGNTRVDMQPTYPKTIDIARDYPLLDIDLCDSRSIEVQS